MIASEVESLQDQLTVGSLEVEEFFAILLSTYEFDASKEWNLIQPFIWATFQTKPILAMSCPYKCTEILFHCHVEPFS